MTTPTDAQTRITDDVDDLWQIMRALKSPREAAEALSALWLRLIIQSEPQDEAAVRAKIKDVNDAVLEGWSKHSGKPLTPTPGRRTDAMAQTRQYRRNFPQ